MTKFLLAYDINSKIVDNTIIEAQAYLKADRLVAFPTDTVYGLGVNAYSNIAIEKLFAIKKRPINKAIIALFYNIEAILEECESNEIFEELANKFLPGGLTLILKKKANSKLSKMLNSGSLYQGVRVPNHEVALSIFKDIEFPVATTSANISNERSALDAKAVENIFQNEEKLLIVGGNSTTMQIESTVLDIANPKEIRILREGVISKEDLEKCGLIFN